MEKRLGGARSSSRECVVCRLFYAKERVEIISKHRHNNLTQQNNLPDKS